MERERVIFCRYKWYDVGKDLLVFVVLGRWYTDKPRLYGFVPVVEVIKLRIEMADKLLDGLLSLFRSMSIFSVRRALPHV